MFVLDEGGKRGVMKRKLDLFRLHSSVVWYGNILLGVVDRQKRSFGRVA